MLVGGTGGHAAHSVNRYYICFHKRHSQFKYQLLPTSLPDALLATVCSPDYKNSTASNDSFSLKIFRSVTILILILSQVEGF